MRSTEVTIAATPEKRLTKLSLSGELTEDTDLNPIVPQLGAQVVVDLERVTRINSCGLREWLSFVQTLEAEGKSLVLERCAPAIVAQLNMIANFTGRSGKVRSIFAPYHCASCGAEHQELIETNAIGRGFSLESGPPCPSCKATMQFDDLPDTYLLFLGANERKS